MCLGLGVSYTCLQIWASSLGWKTWKTAVFAAVAALALVTTTTTAITTITITTETKITTITIMTTIITTKAATTMLPTTTTTAQTLWMFSWSTCRLCTCETDSLNLSDNPIINNHWTCCISGSDTPEQARCFCHMETRLLCVCVLIILLIFLDFHLEHYPPPPPLTLSLCLFLFRCSIVQELNSGRWNGNRSEGKLITDYWLNYFSADFYSSVIWRTGYCFTPAVTKGGLRSRGPRPSWAINIHS